MLVGAVVAGVGCGRFGFQDSAAQRGDEADAAPSADGGPAIDGAIDGAAQARACSTDTAYSIAVSSQPGHRFRYEPSTLTWAAAEASCEAADGHLAVIDNSGELAALFGVASFATWIGGSDVATEGVWLTPTGAPMPYFQWSSGNPNNSGGAQNCLQIYAAGDMDDFDCGTPQDFVCECEP